MNGNDDDDDDKCSAVVNKLKRIELNVKCRFFVHTYSVVSDFKPVNASCAIREILLFDKSMRRNRLKLENAFGVISVIKFCSKRL